MKAFSFIRSSLAGGSAQATPVKAEEPITGVPKVPSLLFDLELEEGGTVHSDQQEDTDVAILAAHVRSLTEPRSEEECQLNTHMALVKRLLNEHGTGKGLDIFEVADGLRKLGHCVTMRSTLGGGGGNECLRNLRHSFLTCRMQGRQGQTDIIVDPTFKEQFEIGHVTSRYAVILAAVPVTFIGTQEQVVAVVEIMSKEISRAFQQAGATLPPWRHTASMLSKWQPCKSQDLHFDAQALDSRAPSLPQDLPPAVLRKHLTAAAQGNLQRHSTANAWPAPRPGGGRVSLDEVMLNRRKTADGSAAAASRPAGAQPAGVVATVQQSINALSRKASFNSVNHAVHLV